MDGKLEEICVVMGVSTPHHWPGRYIDRYPIAHQTDWIFERHPVESHRTQIYTLVQERHSEDAYSRISLSVALTII